MTDSESNDTGESGAAPGRSRIKRLVIEELFGPGSGTIDIEFKLKDRVTILHGRNGSGKTITLGLIEALCRGDDDGIFDYPITRLRMELVDGSWVEYRRNVSAIEIEYDSSVGEQNLSGKMFALDSSSAKTFQPAKPRTMALRSAGLTMSELNGNAVLPGSIRREGNPLGFFHERVPKAKVIRDSRLDADRQRSVAFGAPATRAAGSDGRPLGDSIAGQGHSSAEPTLMVDVIGRDVQVLVQKADQAYRQISTNLDASLAKRLFAPSDPALDPVALKARAKTLTLLEHELVELGLLRTVNDPVDDDQLNASNLSTFKTVLEDREAKLAPFEELRLKSHRLLESVNRKLAPKRIRLHVERGYEVVTANGEALPLSKLSSGEQHQLVLMHELLFDLEPGTLILIDEPELSLHPEWQVQVLGDLLEIAKLSDLDVLVATHSPYIAGDRVDLMVGVGVPNP